MSTAITLPPMSKGQRRWLPINGHERNACFAEIAAQHPGPHGWLAGEGGLIANLRVWENCLLPLSYFGHAPGATDEARFAELLVQLGIPGEEQAAFAGSPVAGLNARQRRLVCALRTLMTQPAWIFAESEWLSRLDEADTQRLTEAFAATCPDSTWLVLGHAQPAPAWQCQTEQTGPDHAAA